MYDEYAWIVPVFFFGCPFITVATIICVVICRYELCVRRRKCCGCCDTCHEYDAYLLPISNTFDTDLEAEKN